MSSPNPNWKPGQKIDSPVEQMVEVDPLKSKVLDIYKLMIGTVVPRPIAFVSTINKKGQVNLAPFSFFNAISSNPPCLVISVSRKPDGQKKDTLINVEETGQFVVNTASSWLTEPLVYCAGEFPYGVSELDKVGLTALASKKIAPPRVKEAAVQMECELYQKVEIGDGGAGSATLIIGKVLLFHIHAKAYKDGKVDLMELNPLARLGGFGYSLIDSSFELRPPQAETLK